MGAVVRDARTVVPLATVYRENRDDVTGWYASEKFDGVRGYWDGERMWSRSGREIAVPEWWICNLPKVRLDGEIYSPTCGLARANAAVRSSSESNRWWGCEYRVFDLPGLESFQWRLRTIKLLESNSVVVPIGHVKVESVEHLRFMVNFVRAKGGEGLVLRHPDMAWKVGRTRQMVKVFNVQSEG